MYAAQHRPLAVTIICRDEDGVAAAPTGSVAVTVLNADGSTAATGTATAGAATGEYTYTRSALVAAGVTASLGTYTVRFTYTLAGVQYRTEVPYIVTGGHLFEIADLRAVDAAIGDANVYTPAEIRDARDKATERLEQAADVAFSTRSRTVTLTGDNTPRLILPDIRVQSVIAVEMDGEAIVDGFEVLEHGVLVLTDGGVWDGTPNNIVVEYEYGYAVTPEPVKRAAMTLAIEYLVPSALPARAMSQSTDLGEFRVSIANVDAGRYTGIPEVDAVIKTFGRQRPAVA